ncbi:hypothetical protein JW960_11650 [candidate division KSB1 bacterium]|nr:hypothetical protein [candidate division KSB1 bacterium]
MNNIIKNKTVSVILILLIGFLATSCDEKTPAEPEATVFDVQGENGFVGTVDGTNAFIALLVTEVEAIVYVCNGDDEDIAEWFRGPIADPADISLTNNNGAQITGKFDASSFTGNVTFSDASVHSYTATPNTGRKTGIFRVYGDQAIQNELVAGWIVNAASEERGSVRVKGKKQSPTGIGGVLDGTSNTVAMFATSYPVFRFFLQRSAADSLQIIAPNN